ncbi:MAG TPA: YlbF family regulator [Candidatus Egerieimonas intestinavium]|uniref:YlbF family regulator n=1 Tax=Candidatus Egerieimonas intestinavium TaxID=2840777 RepID=A0A9D1EKA6_9FIRM|nr:YlbF family regulator [Candidatus Egerieimonas intestinavium]
MDSNVEKCVKALIYAIRTSESYQNYQRCERELAKEPNLREKLDEFRRRVFEMNTSDQVDIYEEADRLEQESTELRLIPVVNDFLAAELEICTTLREVTGRISEEVGVRLPML